METLNFFDNFSKSNLEEILLKNQGIFQVNCKLPVRDKSSLSLVYSPGVGSSCKEIEKDLFKADKLTNRSNSILLVTDTSDFPSSQSSKFIRESVYPYLESICVYYKNFANIDCYPVVFDLASLENDQDFVETLDALMPGYSLVEIFNVKSTKYQVLVEFLNNKKLQNKNYSFIGKYNKRNLDKEIINKIHKNTKNLDFISSNFVYSSIIRAALDLKVYTCLDECLEYLLKFLQNFHTEKNFEDISKNFTDTYKAMDFLIFKSCEFFSNTHEILKKSEKKNILNSINLSRKRFYEFSVIGKCSWIDEYPNNYFLSKNSINDNSILLHWRYRGVIETGCKINFKDPKFFSKIFSWENLDYVAELISKDPSLANKITYKGNFGAIITNGTAILGFGDIGALAGLPVMEGKSVLFKVFGGINIMPLCIQEKNIKKFISIVKKISPSFSAINLEDIKAPDCFEIETTLINMLPYPVFHDDQHGTAIVVLSGIINSLKLSEKKIQDVKIVMNGAGAAGLSVCDLLLTYGAKNIIVCDTTGAIYTGRKKNMNSFKDQLALKTNLNKESGVLVDVIKKADIFIGVSAPKTLTKEMIRTMNEKAIIFALANPDPEIYPNEAYEAGAFIVATGRSDMKNQVNNSLAFPGIFRAAIDVKSPKITIEMKLAAAKAISDLIKVDELNYEYIIPDALDTRVPIAVTKAVAKTAIDLKLNEDMSVSSEQVEDNLTGWLLEEKLKNWDGIKKNDLEFKEGVLKAKF